jgi:hypothetical protein
MDTSITQTTVSQHAPMEQSLSSTCKLVAAKAIVQLAQALRHTALPAKMIQTINNFLHTKDSAYPRVHYILIYLEINVNHVVLDVIIAQLIPVSTVMLTSTVIRTNAIRIATQLACNMIQVFLLMVKKYVCYVPTAVIHVQEFYVRAVWPTTLYKMERACLFVWFLVTVNHLSLIKYFLCQESSPWLLGRL